MNIDPANIYLLIWAAVIVPSGKAHRVAELEEIVGPLTAIVEVENGILAKIGKIQAYLPAELSEKLQGLIGKRVGVLRLEGYRVKAFDLEDFEEEDHA